MNWVEKVEKDELCKKIVDSNSEYLRLKDWGMVLLEVGRLEKGTLTGMLGAGWRGNGK